MFQKEFTKEQKAAIMTSLISVAMANGRMQQTEMTHLAKVADLLDFNMNDPFFESFTGRGFSSIEEVLKTLEDNQKEWLVVALHELLLSDKPPHERKLQYTFGICESIGISESKFLEATRKAELLGGKYFGTSNL